MFEKSNTDSNHIKQNSVKTNLAINYGIINCATKLDQFDETKSRHLPNFIQKIGSNRIKIYASPKEPLEIIFANKLDENGQPKSFVKRFESEQEFDINETSLIYAKIENEATNTIYIDTALSFYIHGNEQDNTIQNSIIWFDKDNNYVFINNTSNLIKYISELSATELGWGRGSGYNNTRGESDPCSGFVTFEEALQHAHDLGARLPTLDELLNGAAHGTGCGYDNQKCWTCTKGEDATEHWCARGLDGKGTEEVRSNTDKAYVRMVADVDINREDSVTIDDFIIANSGHIQHIFGSPQIYNKKKKTYVNARLVVLGKIIVNPKNNQIERIETYYPNKSISTIIDTYPFGAKPFTYFNDFLYAGALYDTKRQNNTISLEDEYSTGYHIFDSIDISNAKTVDFSQLQYISNSFDRLEFKDGDNTYVDFGNPNELQLLDNTPFSIFCRFGFDFSISDHTICCRNNNRSGSPYDYIIQIRNSNTFRAYDGGSWRYISLDENLISFKEYHIGIIFNGSRLYLYLDNEYINDISFSYTMSASNTFKIGGYSNTNDPTGYIHDFVFYNRFLNNDEINKIYNFDLPSENLSIDCSMNEGYGEHIYNRANNIHGQIVNCVWKNNIETHVALSNDNGITYSDYQTIYNYDDISILTQGHDISNSRLRFKQILTRDNIVSDPEIYSFYVNINDRRESYVSKTINQNLVNDESTNLPIVFQSGSPSVSNGVGKYTISEYRVLDINNNIVYTGFSPSFNHEITLDYIIRDYLMPNEFYKWQCRHFYKNIGWSKYSDPTSFIFYESFSHSIHTYSQIKTHTWIVPDKILFIDIYTDNDIIEQYRPVYYGEEINITVTDNPKYIKAYYLQDITATLYVEEEFYEKSYVYPFVYEAV